MGCATGRRSQAPRAALTHRAAVFQPALHHGRCCAVIARASCYRLGDIATAVARVLLRREALSAPAPAPDMLQGVLKAARCSVCTGGFKWLVLSQNLYHTHAELLSTPNRSVLHVSVSVPAQGASRAALWAWLRAQMQAMDFEGLFLYKLIIPAFTWGSILSTFLGPFLFPAAWFSFVAVFMVTFVLVSLFQARCALLCALFACSNCGLRALCPRFLPSKPSCVLMCDMCPSCSSRVWCQLLAA